MIRKFGALATCALLLFGAIGCDFNDEEPFEDDGIIEENGEGEEGNGDGMLEEEEEEE